MKKLTKGKAFWASYWGLLACYAATSGLAPDALPSVGSAIVIALAAAGGIYQAANVADNGVKGAHYHAELDREGK